MSVDVHMMCPCIGTIMKYAIMYTCTHPAYTHTHTHMYKHTHTGVQLAADSTVLHERPLVNGQLWDSGPAAVVPQCHEGCARTQPLDVCCVIHRCFVSVFCIGVVVYVLLLDM